MTELLRSAPSDRRALGELKRSGFSNPSGALQNLHSLAPTPRDVIAYAGFLVIAAAINLRTSVAQVNPLLYLLGYRVLSVTDDRGLRAYIITKRSLQPGERVAATRFRDDVLVDRSA